MDRNEEAMNLMEDVIRCSEGITHLQGFIPTKVNTAIVLDIIQTFEKAERFIKYIQQEVNQNGNNTAE